MKRMEVVKLKWKKILTGWKRCRSLGGGDSRSNINTLKDRLRRTVSEKCELKKKQIAPEGCFSVYVGPEKQRFVVRTELVNHPLFKMLLEDAELEYGFCSEGPILLPCEVDLFYKVLAEIESSSDDVDHHFVTSSCNCNCSPFMLRSPGANYNRPNYSINDDHHKYRLLISPDHI